MRKKLATTVQVSKVLDLGLRARNSGLRAGYTYELRGRYLWGQCNGSNRGMLENSGGRSLEPVMIDFRI